MPRCEVAAACPIPAPNAAGLPNRRHRSVTAAEYPALALAKRGSAVSILRREQDGRRAANAGATASWDGVGPAGILPDGGKGP